MFDFDSAKVGFEQQYMDSMDRQMKQLQASLNMIQPRSVENNRTIHIGKVELQGVNDVQTLMRDLDNIASTINSDAQQRAWKH